MCKRICVFTLLTLSAVSAVYAQGVAEAQALLHIMAQRTGAVHSLYTTFEQEKKLTILTQPLRSQGFLCLHKPQKSSQQEQQRLVWAYTAPQVTGFASLGEKNYHWKGSIQQARAAGGAEAMALQSVSEHIQAWVQVDPKALQKLYTIQSRVHEGKTLLLLEPKQKQNFFTQLEAELRPSLDGIQALTFWEKNGDSMRITFAEPVFNAPLPASCLDLP